VGISAFRKAFDKPGAEVGRHGDDLAGAMVWLLPSTSGLNAHYQAKDFARLFRKLRQDLDS
jgi:TDG/mug DNA glycosylase family protein